MMMENFTGTKNVEENLTETKRCDFILEGLKEKF